jgi:hypothetical protein
MIKSIIAIIILIIAESARRFFEWRSFKKSPVGRRCKFLTDSGWIKGDVEARITEGSYYVFADDGNMWRTSIDYMRPVYWEL